MLLASATMPPDDAADNRTPTGRARRSARDGSASGARGRRAGAGRAQQRTSSPCGSDRWSPSAHCSIGATIDGERLVTADDLTGRAYWIPADAVWSDADHAERPQHPRPVGLATARHAGAGVRSRAQRPARLGGRPRLRAGRSPAAGRDGAGAGRRRRPPGRARRPAGARRPDRGRARRRLRPLGGGGDLVDRVHRALYGDDGSIAVERELAEITTALRRGRTRGRRGRPRHRPAAPGGCRPLLGAARAPGVTGAVVACPSDEPGRPWDAGAVD